MTRLLCLLVALAACRERGAGPADAAPPPAPDAPPAGPEVVRIDDMAVVAPLWPKEAGPPPEEAFVARRMWEGLTQSPMFALKGSVPPARASGVRVRRARLHVTVGVEITKAPRLLRGAAHVELEWLGGGEDRDLSETDACETELRVGARVPEVAQGAVECALARAAGGLIARETVRRGDEKAVIAALSGSDPSLRQAAFAAVADHRLSAAVPRLLELLKSDDAMARDGAIGALVALRDPRAVKPLADLGQFNDLDMMRRVIDAIGAIGGEEARAYLEMVASGHDVPGIRALAKDALGRMDRKEHGD
ncbi:MAG TPA: HEAT repeat domain-containing protein [Haliangiales bacterium]|nr:HEAT repeat domain-containing protein [Haliangiales bacterium]